MEFNIRFSFYLLLIIKIALSEIYDLKKIPTKIKSLRVRRRTLDNNKEDTFLEEVYGDSYELNYYYATLYLGPKKIPQTYILDTGSPTTTSPCNKCRSCGKHLNKPYELNDDSNYIQCYSDKCNSLSSSYCIDHKCGFSISYSEGSRLAGFFNTQEIYFERINKTPNITTQSFKIPIGCTTTETHLFVTQLADGIMGLNNSGKSFVSLLFKNKVISKDLFTICFGQNDGYFSIGEIDTSYHKTPIEYIPLIRGENNFYVNINNMKVGDRIISTKQYRGFVDSGTTISYFPKEIYKSIINEFHTICEKYDKKCGQFRNVDNLGYCGFFDSVEDKEKALNEYWPNITIAFQGHNYVLTANDYYYDYTENKIGACLGFEGEYASKITLGGTFMHGHDVIFDKGNQRIGFAVADCNRGGSEKAQSQTLNENDKNINVDNTDYDTTNINKKIFVNKNILPIVFILLAIIFVVMILIILFIALKKCIFKRKYQPQVDETSTPKKRDVRVIEVKTDNKN